MKKTKKNATVVAKKKTHWLTRILAGLGILCVLGAAAFSVMWFVPQIHDKIWKPAEQTEQEQQANTDTPTTSLNSKVLTLEA